MTETADPFADRPPPIPSDEERAAEGRYPPFVLAAGDEGKRRWDLCIDRAVELFEDSPTSESVVMAARSIFFMDIPTGDPDEPQVTPTPPEPPPEPPQAEMPEPPPEGPLEPEPSPGEPVPPVEPEVPGGEVQGPLPPDGA